MKGRRADGRTARQLVALKFQLLQSVAAANFAGQHPRDAVVAQIKNRQLRQRRQQLAGDTSEQAKAGHVQRLQEVRKSRSDGVETVAELTSLSVQRQVFQHWHVFKQRRRELDAVNATNERQLNVPHPWKKAEKVRVQVERQL